MAALGKKLRTAEGDRIRFHCPGCNDFHDIRVTGNPNECWTFNGNAEKPTFTPSVLVRSGHFANPDKKACWCTYNAEHPDAPSPFKCYQCHSFVTDGQIQFLDDCTHGLAGKTVPLPDYPA